jgi:hypothetical protein
MSEEFELAISVIQGQEEWTEQLQKQVESLRAKDPAPAKSPWGDLFETLLWIKSMTDDPGEFIPEDEMM